MLPAQNGWAAQRPGPYLSKNYRKTGSRPQKGGKYLQSQSHISDQTRLRFKSSALLSRRKHKSLPALLSLLAEHVWLHSSTIARSLDTSAGSMLAAFFHCPLHQHPPCCLWTENYSLNLLPGQHTHSLFCLPRFPYRAQLSS